VEWSGEFRKRESVFLKWARESKSAFMFQRFVFFFFCRWYRPIRGFGILMGQMLDGCDLKAVVLRARAVLGMGGTMVM